MNRPAAPPSRRRLWGRAFACITAGVALAALFAVVWIGVRGGIAYQHLREAQTTASEVIQSPLDTAAAASAVKSVAADTEAARSLTSDPVWEAAEHLAWIGPQLHAVSTVAAALDDVAGDSLSPLLQVAQGFSPETLRPVGGAIDLTRFDAAQEASETAAHGIADAAASVGALDVTVLAAPLRGPVSEVSELLEEASTGADALARASRLLPAMMGATEPRQYLVVFQNNAEWRSLGGIAGAMAVVRTDNGALSLVDQASSADFPPFAEPVLPLSATEVQLFGTQPARFVQNVTQIPDFTRGAPIAREMWKRQRGVEVDGVIAVDPVALSYVLRATGPLTLPSGDVIDADNAVDLLLNGVYQRFEDPTAQDAFFAQASAAVFTAIAGGAAEPSVLLAALTQAGDEHRLLVWNTRLEEQSVLDGTTLQGRFTQSTPEETSFGVFLNDDTASKMSYYLRIGAVSGLCPQPDGSVTAEMQVTLRSDAPVDAASLPTYITGSGSGAPRGSAATVAYVYLPAGSELVSTEIADGADKSGVSGGQDAGRQVVAWSTTLAPGQSSTLTVRVSPASSATPTTVVTPVVNTNVTPELAFGCVLAQ